MKKEVFYLAVVLVVSFLSVIAVLGSDLNLTLQPDSDAGIDNYIMNGAAQNTNYGTDTSILLGVAGDGTKMRGLLLFNTTSVPVGSTVTWAELKIYVYDGSADATNISVYALNQSWDETSSTWNARNSTDNWANAGSDYNRTAINTTNMSSTGTWYNISVKGLVQKWIDNSSTNFGFLVKSDEATVGSYKIAYSSDYGTAGLRPILSINYTPNSAPTISSITDNSNTTNPTNFSRNVSFSVAWSDIDSTKARLYVCNSSLINTTGCNATEFCSTANLTSSTLECNYTAQETDASIVSYWVAVCDDEGSSTTCSVISAEYNFSVNHKPNITMVLPNGGEYINQTAQGNYTIKFNVSDSDNDSLYVTLYYSVSAGNKTSLIKSDINTADYCTDSDSSAITANNCTYYWNSSEISGNFFLDALVRDAHGLNALDSSDAIFQVDSLSDVETPHLDNNSITASITSGESYIINATVSDTYLANVWVFVNSSTTSTRYTMQNLTEATKFSVTVTAGAAGIWYYRVYANDTVGNQNTTSWTAFNITKPNATVQNEYFPSKALPASTIKISVDINNTDFIEAAYAYLHKPLYSVFLTDYPQNTSIGNLSAGTSTATWFLSVPHITGTYAYNVTITDKYGNEWNSTNHNVAVTEDMGTTVPLSVSIVGGTEYKSGEMAEISVFVKNGSGYYVTGANCDIIIYNTSHASTGMNDMAELGSGIYYRNFTTSAVEGIYTAWVNCSYNATTGYDAHTFHVAPWANQIDLLYNNTFNTPTGSIVDYGTTPSNTSVGAAATVWLKIYNSGNVTTNYRVSTQIKYSNTIKYSVSDTVTSVTAGEERTYNMSETWTPDVAGTHAITVSLKSADGATTYDSHASTFDVPGELTYDVSVKCLSSQADPGDSVTANITLSNLGDYYTDVQLTWWIENSGGTNLVSSSLPIAVYPSQSRTLEESLVLPTSATSGTHYYKAQVAYGNTTRTGYCSFTVGGGGAAAGGGGGAAKAAAAGGEEATEEITVETAKKAIIEAASFEDATNIGIGSSKIVDFTIENSGTADMHNVYLTIDGLLFDWYIISPTKIALVKPGEKATFEVKFIIPETTEPKDYFFSYKVVSDEATLIRNSKLAASSLKTALQNDLEKLKEKASYLNYAASIMERKNIDVSNAKFLLNIIAEKINSIEGSIKYNDFKTAELDIKIANDYMDQAEKELERFSMFKEISYTFFDRYGPWIITWIILIVLIAVLFLLYTGQNPEFIKGFRKRKLFSRKKTESEEFEEKIKRLSTDIYPSRKAPEQPEPEQKDEEAESAGEEAEETKEATEGEETENKEEAPAEEQKEEVHEDKFEALRIKAKYIGDKMKQKGKALPDRILKTQKSQKTARQTDAFEERLKKIQNNLNKGKK